MAHWKLKKPDLPGIALAIAILGLVVFGAGFAMIDRPANTVSVEADALAHNLMLAGAGMMFLTMGPIFIAAVVMGIFSALFEKTE